jgi:hypothetical protein
MFRRTILVGMTVASALAIGVAHRRRRALKGAPENAVDSLLRSSKPRRCSFVDVLAETRRRSTCSG